MSIHKQEKTFPESMSVSTEKLLNEENDDKNNKKSSLSKSAENVIIPYKPKMETLAIFKIRAMMKELVSFFKSFFVDPKLKNNFNPNTPISNVKSESKVTNLGQKYYEDFNNLFDESLWKESDLVERRTEHLKNGVERIIQKFIIIEMSQDIKLGPYMNDCKALVVIKSLLLNPHGMVFPTLTFLHDFKDPLGFYHMCLAIQTTLDFSYKQEDNDTFLSTMKTNLTHGKLDLFYNDVFLLDGKTILYKLIECDNMALLKTLFDKGKIDVSKLKEVANIIDGSYPLHGCSSKQMYNYLIEKGAKPKLNALNEYPKFARIEEVEKTRLDSNKRIVTLDDVDSDSENESEDEDDSEDEEINDFFKKLEKRDAPRKPDDDDVGSDFSTPVSLPSEVGYPVVPAYVDEKLNPSSKVCEWECCPNEKNDRNWKGFGPGVSKVITLHLLELDPSNARYPVPIRGSQTMFTDLLEFFVIKDGKKMWIRCRKVIPKMSMKWQWLNMKGKWMDFDRNNSKNIDREFRNDKSRRNHSITLNVNSMNGEELTHVNLKSFEVLGPTKKRPIRFIPSFDKKPSSSLEDGSSTDEVEEGNASSVDDLSRVMDEVNNPEVPEEERDKIDREVNEMNNEADIAKRREDKYENQYNKLTEQMEQLTKQLNTLRLKNEEMNKKNEELKDKLPPNILIKEETMILIDESKGEEFSIKVDLENAITRKGKVIFEFLMKKFDSPIPPVIFFGKDKKKNSTITIVGVKIHILNIKLILKRLRYLYLKVVNSMEKLVDAEKFMGRFAKRVEKFGKYNARRRKNETSYTMWKQYVENCKEWIANEMRKVKKKYLDNLNKLMHDKDIMNAVIIGKKKWKKVIISDVNQIVTGFSNYIEKMKLSMIVNVIRDLFRNEMRGASKRMREENRTDKKSAIVMLNFVNLLAEQHENNIDKILKQGQSNAVYKVIFSETIPEIIFRFTILNMLYYKNLPIFKHSLEVVKDLQTKVKGKGKVVSIKTTTGSGKSTVLPLILYATKSTNKIGITQPRRLPCSSVASFIERTYGKGIIGWMVSGKSKNPENPIVFLTDGLLREFFLHSHKKVFKSFDIIMLDEVHERGINMDLLIALMCKLIKKMAKKKKKKKYPKIILSSATLDPAVIEPFEKNRSRFNVRKFEYNKISPYKINEEWRTGEHPIEVVVELVKKKKREHQILCFLPTIFEIERAIKFMDEEYGLKTYPLYSQQSFKNQEEILKRGDIFFSTNIAETSLTFPNLKYVVDNGKTQTAVIDRKLGCLKVIGIDAAISTLTQRKGRVGRTCEGFYFKCYEKSSKRRVKRTKYPTPQISRIELLNIDFALRRSREFVGGLKDLNKFLPTKINLSGPGWKHSFKTLKYLKITDSEGELTSTGYDLIQMPFVGGPRYALCILHAFRHGCGDDMIKIISCLLSLPNRFQGIIKSMPKGVVSKDGDFMTFLNYFKLSYRKYSWTGTFDSPFIRKAIKRYLTIKNEFQKTKYAMAANQSTGGSWKTLCKCLLKAYFTNTFFSCKELAGHYAYFIQMHPNGKYFKTMLDDRSMKGFTTMKPGTLCFIAASIFSTEHMAHVIDNYPKGNIQSGSYSTEKIEMEKVQLTRVSLLGRVKMKWLVHKIKGKKAKKILAKRIQEVQTKKTKKKITFNKDFKWFTQQHSGDVNYDTGILPKLTDIGRNKRIFGPMKYRWKNNHQVDVRVSKPSVKIVDKQTQTNIVFDIEGKKEYVEYVEQEVKEFAKWISRCDRIVSHFKKDKNNNGQIILKPTPLKCYTPRNADIEERITRITNDKRSFVSLWKSTMGKDATRESRMEVVAWIAVCKFGADLVGGFIRDWVIRKDKSYTGIVTKANFDPTVIPQDLDFKLSTSMDFDLTRFVKEVQSFGITVDGIERVGKWRYVMHLNEKKGGYFTCDFIEPHIRLCHDKMDIDVNNLYVRKNWTKEFGMLVNTSLEINRDKKLVSLQSTIDNALKKEFVLLLDDKIGYMKSRLKKMTQVRGWTVTRTESFNPSLINATVTPMWNSKSNRMGNLTSNEKKLVNEIKSMGCNPRDIVMYKITNKLLEDVYENNKQVIRMQAKNLNFSKAENEATLYHGSGTANAKSIQDFGLDYRFWNGGAFGPGGYFANDPNLSNRFTQAVNNRRNIFVFKVMLGKQKVVTQTGSYLNPGNGFHSIHAPSSTFGHNEYIIYSYGQALPLYKFEYQ